ncbi:MAG: 30S ribosomal protein S16 [Opitutales bacterium]|nr:30S ribosomal protein S16 [Opitutales bacterium]
MALRIRLQRHGSTHNPTYRVVVAEQASRRDGKFVENLGYYNPKARGQEIEVNLDLARVDYWTSVGAQMSDTAKALVKRAKKAAANA